MAAQEGHVECVKVLLEKGANIDIPNNVSEELYLLGLSRSDLTCLELTSITIVIIGMTLYELVLHYYIISYHIISYVLLFYLFC